MSRNSEGKIIYGHGDRPDTYGVAPEERRPEVIEANRAARRALLEEPLAPPAAPKKRAKRTRRKKSKTA